MFEFDRQTWYLIGLATLAVVAVGVYYFYFRGTAKSDGGAATQNATATQSKPPMMSLDEVKAKYGDNALKIVSCVRTNSTDKQKARQCVIDAFGGCSDITDPGCCMAQGLDGYPNCTACNMNPTACAAQAALFARLQKDGVIPTY
eukprot:m.330685 g.330685  ORF g.330685 m.330685 type:complete len:145 (+) comp67340_c0_seq1:20-454(+)